MKRDRKRRYLTAVAVGLVTLILGGSSATAAFGSTWTGRQLTGEASKVMMFGVSCPTASLCVAVGGNNTLASSTNPTGGTESWNVATRGCDGLRLAASFFNAGRSKASPVPRRSSAWR